MVCWLKLEVGSQGIWVVFPTLPHAHCMTDWLSASVSLGVKNKKRNQLEEDILAADPSDLQALQKLAQPSRMGCGSHPAPC